MGTRRLLFVRPASRASLVPIYAALLLVASLGLAGLGLGLWLDPGAPAAQPRHERETASTSRPRSGGLNVPSDSRAPRRDGTWM